jgi:hypothetical protein
VGANQGDAEAWRRGEGSHGSAPSGRVKGPGHGRT